MPPFKIKFTAHPQHDAEGFTAMDAKCRGCTPDEMCPRSGHCERYESPLRDIDGIAAEMIHSRVRLVTDLGEVKVQRTNLDWANPKLNPRGWQEVDGVALPPINWATVEAAVGVGAADAFKAFINPSEPVKLSEMTDQELNEVHSHWLRMGRSE